ncbi:MAG: helix-turn-helix domain-containing protein, partial [Bifidobacteriaceae bacterium]|nr:helix-turn-helix domain-containing protein [Bifidobacteriaceae bacterium]
YGRLVELKSFLNQHQGQPVLTTADGASTELPETVYQIIIQAVDVLVAGSAVAVDPVPVKLSTTQAAEILRVSWSTLIKMLDRGRIPFQQNNIHRTLNLSDVLAFKDRHRNEREKYLAEMTEEELNRGLDDEIYKDYNRFLENV